MHGKTASLASQHPCIQRNQAVLVQVVQPGVNSVPHTQSATALAWNQGKFLSCWLEKQQLRTRNAEGSRKERMPSWSQGGCDLSLGVFIHLVNNSFFGTASSSTSKQHIVLIGWNRITGLTSTAWPHLPCFPCCWTAEKILYFQKTTIIAATCPFVPIHNDLLIPFHIKSIYWLDLRIEMTDNHLHDCQGTRLGTMAGTLLLSTRQIPHSISLGVPEFLPNLAELFQMGEFFGVSRYHHFSQLPYHERWWTR